MKRYLFWLLVLLSAFFYICTGYYTERSQFSLLFIQIFILFLLFIGIQFVARNNLFEDKSLRIVQFSGIAFRALLLLQIPNLSDDFYRFLWDGNMGVNSLNPYLILPESYIENTSLNEFQMTLFDGMNSKSYFTIYPPFNQYIFSLAARIFPLSIHAEVIIIKLLIFITEIITVFNLPRLLSLLNINKAYSYLYILNPLVIIESMGNLHFEVFTICFLCLSFIFILQSKWLKSSIFFGLAVSVKFIPLLILPFIIRYLGLKRGIPFALITLLVLIVPFLPFFDLQISRNIFSSIELYFQSFEFNASVYYLIRYIGFKIMGYNIIHFSGILLSSLTIILLIFLFIRQKKHDVTNLFEVCFLGMLLFYLLSTTVHPWYIINLLFFALLSRFKWSMVLWTFLVFLSYSAYSNSDYMENLWLVSLEYILVFVMLYIEFSRKNIFQLKSTYL